VVFVDASRVVIDLAAPDGVKVGWSAPQFPRQMGA
jgi:hypothetical protein